MAFILGIGSAFVEIVLIRKVRPLRWINERSQIAGFAVSVLISFLLGSIFGMAGLVVGIAAILSTMFTEPIWYANRKMRESHSKTGYWIKEAKDTWTPMLGVLKIAAIIALSPIWVPVKIRRAYLNAVGSQVS